MPSAGTATSPKAWAATETLAPQSQSARDTQTTVRTTNQIARLVKVLGGGRFRTGSGARFRSSRQSAQRATPETTSSRRKVPQRKQTRGVAVMRPVSLAEPLPSRPERRQPGAVTPDEDTPTEYHAPP
jgi:hypothetical protein